MDVTGSKTVGFTTLQIQIAACLRKQDSALPAFR